MGLKNDGDSPVCSNLHQARILNIYQSTITGLDFERQ